jgi:hypothetical protein
VSRGPSHNALLILMIFQEYLLGPAFEFGHDSRLVERCYSCFDWWELWCCSSVQRRR